MDTKEYKILILEDVPTDAELMERELRKGGLTFVSKRVMTKDDFSNALDAFLPDLILSDYKLPQFDGLSALAIAKEKCPDTPFIFVTGAMGDEMAVETLKKGAVDCVLKDNLSHLVPAVGRAFREVLERAKRVAVEVKIEEERSKYWALLMSIGEGVIATNDEGNVILVNPSAQDMLGITDLSLIGKALAAHVLIVDEKGNSVLDEQYPTKFALSLLGKLSSASMVTSYSFIRKDKTKFPAIITATPVILNDKFLGVILVFHDITREKELDRIKTEFVDLASHQLRTPLTGIEWTVDSFARKEKLTDEGKSYLRDIRSSAKRLNALVKLLLNASRIEGSVEVVSESIDLIGLTDEYLRECQVLFEKKNLTLLFSHPENLTALTDKNLFGHILQNFVGNSIDYTPAGGKIEVSLEKRENTFLLRVCNTGAAIPQKDQAHIFEKFFRSPAAVAVKPDGTGLGLYIASEAVKLLGGKIWFESPTTDGGGTAFYVELSLQTRAKEGEKHLADH